MSSCDVRKDVEESAFRNCFLVVHASFAVLGWVRVMLRLLERAALESRGRLVERLTHGCWSEGPDPNSLMNTGL